MVWLELRRFCDFLCAAHFCRCLRTWLAHSWNFPANDYRWSPALAAFFTTVDGKRRRQRIPVASLGSSVVIFSGVLLIQWQHATELHFGYALATALPVAAAAFAYPLGNRKMMEVTDGQLDTFSRVLGMTLFTTPFWLALFFYGVWQEGLPSISQVGQTALVSICAGIIATLLFFYATDITRRNPNQLAAVEATQSGAVFFSVTIEVLLLGGAVPPGTALVGLGLIIGGMILHSFLTRSTVKTQRRQRRVG